MKGKSQPKPASPKGGLAIRAASDTPLSRTQVEFNRLMKSLEAAKVRHTREQERLDKTLITAIRELMPLIEDLNRINFDLVLNIAKTIETSKFNAARRHELGDVLRHKAGGLIADPIGLGEPEVARLQALVAKLTPPEEDTRVNKSENEELSAIRAMMKQAARQFGIDLDLSDLDLNANPEEFHRIASERLRAAFENNRHSAADDKPRRKPTKAQAETERKSIAQMEAKNRDLKSLFKQLAKAFHPDLEPDPLLKEHKKVWMQRLNAAYAISDLREMLQLEMEWLGEEATNLATAGDQKLQVYCMVLKEQITDLKRQTYRLVFEPQYGPLHRFRDPYYGTIASPVSIKRELQDELSHHQKMLKVLSANNAASRRMIYDWADENASRASDLF
jgi:hypothetical protein